MYPGVEGTADEDYPHRDIHDVLNGTQPNDCAIGGATAISLFARVALEFLIFERLVGEEEDVSDVGKDIDHAAGNSRPGLIVRDGATGAFATDEQANREVHGDCGKGRGGEQGTRDIEVRCDKGEEERPWNEIEHRHVKQREHLVG